MPRVGARLWPRGGLRGGLGVCLRLGQWWGPAQCARDHKPPALASQPDISQPESQRPMDIHPEGQPARDQPPRENLRDQRPATQSLRDQRPASQRQISRPGDQPATDQPPKVSETMVQHVEGTTWSFGCIMCRNIACRIGKRGFAWLSKRTLMRASWHLGAFSGRYRDRGIIHAAWPFQLLQYFRPRENSPRAPTPAKLF